MKLLNDITRGKWYDPRSIFFLFFIVYSLCIFIPKPDTLAKANGDEPHYLIMTYSILHDHDLKLENNYTNRDYKNWYPVKLIGHLIAFRDVNYPLHQPGLSLYILPFFLIAERIGVLLFLAALTSMSMVNIYETLRFFVKNSTALYTTLLVGFSVPVFAYATLIYPEIVVLFLISCILRIVLNPLFTLKMNNAVVLVLLFTLILPLHIKFALLSGMILTYINVLLFNKIKLKYLFVFDLAVAITSVAYLVWMYHFFGGYFFEPLTLLAAGNNFLIQHAPSGLLGSLVDRENGMLIYSPFYIFVFVSFGYFFKGFKKMIFEKKLKIIFLTIFIGVQTLFVTTYPHILGGQNPSGRYFLPIIPALAIVLSVGLTSLLKLTFPRFLMILFTVYTVFITVVIGLRPDLILPAGGGNNLVTFVLRDHSVIIHKALPNLSKFHREITPYDYQKGFGIFGALLMASFIQTVLFKKKNGVKIS